MQKEIVNTHTDEVTKITRVHYADGTFDAFPAGTFPVGAVSVEVDEKEEFTEEVIPAVVGVDSFAFGVVDDATPDEIELGDYRVIGEIPYTDEEGTEQGMTEIGSIQTVPVALGEYWVSEGLAERVIPEVETI